MLRLIQSGLLGIMCVLVAQGLAQPLERWVFERDRVEFDVEGGCADNGAGGLWLFVRARQGDKRPHRVELWFVNVGIFPEDPSDRLRVVNEETAQEAFSIGCVVSNQTRLAWRLVNRGKLLLHRLSHDGLEPITVEFAGRWAYPVKAVAFAQGVLTLAAADAVGIFDVEAGTVARHERWTAAAWINPDTAELYSVRSVGSIDEDADGFPPIALTREVILPNGGLRLLAETEPWPAMRPVEEGSFDQIGQVEHQLVVTPDEVLLLRGHYFGTGRLQVSAWDKALRFDRSFLVDIHGSPGRSGVFDAGWIAGQLVLAVPEYSGRREPVRLLHVDGSGIVRESKALATHPGTLLDLALFEIGSSVYAVATQWTHHETRPLTVDVFAVPPLLPDDAAGLPAAP